MNVTFYLWTLFIQPKIPKISKREQMVKKFPGNPKIFEFSKSEPFNRKFPKFQEGRSNGTEISGKKFPKISIYLALFRKFRKKVAPFVTGNFRKFSSNGKRPVFLLTVSFQSHDALSNLLFKSPVIISWRRVACHDVSRGPETMLYRSNPHAQFLSRLPHNLIRKNECFGISYFVYS